MIKYGNILFKHAAYRYNAYIHTVVSDSHFHPHRYAVGQTNCVLHKRYVLYLRPLKNVCVPFCPTQSDFSGFDARYWIAAAKVSAV